MGGEKSLETIELESFREQREDGFIEINLGSYLLILFNMLYVAFVFPNVTIFDAWVKLIIPIIGMFCLLLLFAFYGTFRKKYVYPRIGYVKLHDDSSRVLSILLIVMILTLAAEIIAMYFISVNMVGTDWVYRWAPFFFGLLMFTVSFYPKEKSGQNRYYVFGALMTITGLAVALADFISAEAVPVIYFDGWGTAIIVLGIIKFVLFVRRYPIISVPEVVSSE